jgi:hypothetical protein
MFNLKPVGRCVISLPSALLVAYAEDIVKYLEKLNIKEGRQPLMVFSLLKQLNAGIL